MQLYRDQPSPVAIVMGMAKVGFAIGLIAVTVLSLVPSDTLPSLDLWDKVEHAVAYAFLAATGCFGFGFGSRAPCAQLAVVLALTAMGGAIELVQPLAPGRTASFEDMLANVIGIALGWLLARSAAVLLLRPRPA